MTNLELKDNRFPNKKFIPVVHTGIYYVIECTFAEAKNANIAFEENLCKDIKDDEKGLITYWYGKELWMPYDITANDTFTLLTEDKNGNKYNFERLILNKDKTKVNNKDYSIHQEFDVCGTIYTKNDKIIDIREEIEKRNNDVAFTLDTQYLQVKLVSGTKCTFAKACEFNIPGAYEDLGYKDDTKGTIILHEMGLVWIPENQSWNNLRELKKDDKNHISYFHIKDFDFKDNDGVINVGFNKIDINTKELFDSKYENITDLLP